MTLHIEHLYDVWTAYNKKLTLFELWPKNNSLGCKFQVNETFHVMMF